MTPTLHGDRIQVFQKGDVMEREEKVIYYRDELNDEFAGDNIVTKQIDGNYRYLRKGIVGRLLHVFFYRLIATPLAFLYMKLHFHHKMVNKKALRQVRHKAFYLYGNHTHFMADALIPTMVSFPRKISVIVHPNNVSMPVLGKITPYLGALPLPDERKAYKNFMDAMKELMQEEQAIMIYPEAHIWPFYTDIRPFKDTSFHYPVQYKVPVFSLTNTYQKRRFSKNPQIVTYIDGPFYADSDKTAKEQKQELRNQVYQCMKERAKRNNMEIIKYIKIEEKRESRDD